MIERIQPYLRPRSSVGFWHSRIAPMTYDFPSLNGYYIDLSSKTFYGGPFDEHGAPLLDYGGKTGRHTNPCATAQYGLGWYCRFVVGDNAAKQKFLKMADWLYGRMEMDSAQRGWWRYDFDNPAYGVLSPWVSGLAQGQGISLLLRAFRQTDDMRWLEKAKAACRGMLLPVEEGGLLRREQDNVFIEEIVAARKTAILDGMIFAVFGLFDYCYVTGDDQARMVLRECVDTIERMLPRYDLGYWSRSDLFQEQPPMIASTFYHRLHIAQLHVLSSVTGNPVFRQYASAWEEYQRRPMNRVRAVLEKARFKLLYY